MAYVQSKVMKRRLQDKRRVSGAALLREELNNDGNNNSGSSLLDGLPTIQQDKGVMMANFEEWIKMATDNKINSTNSWNFALIDYFHDMNVLRESDNNINFQKASATLDGCVKIYSSRVDSVATETGRLLSGLATRKDVANNSDEDEENRNDEDANDENSDDENQQKDTDSYREDNGSRKSKKLKPKDSSNMLTTFENIRIKKLSLELAIDPLFKKTLSEFDEGGAKSLLLNTLNMDSNSRVVFDASSTNTNDEKDEYKITEIDENEDIEMSGIQDDDLDISVFKKFLFNNESELDEYTLCPSIGHLETVLKDINQAKSILNDVNQKNSEEDEGSLPAPDFDFDYGGGGYDDVDYGDDINDSYGELDKEAADVIFQNDLREDQIETGDKPGVIASVVDQDLMAYFDSTMKRNWAGPEHWKVAQLKKVKITTEGQNASDLVADKIKKVKEQFTIDFLSIEDKDTNDELEKLIFSKSKNSSKDQSITSDSNLLPNDLYFSSAKLTALFSKPSQKLDLFRRKVNIRRPNENLQDQEDKQEPDATFWAENYDQSAKKDAIAEEQRDDNYDNDNGFDMSFVDFGDYGGEFEDGAPQADEKVNFGTQLITGSARIKPEYVNYSKTAKNVNIKKLKDNIWKVMEHEQKNDEEGRERQFSTVVKDIGRLYPKEQKKDLSTSFCFICLLHLANEHSLTIQTNHDLSDLKISGVNPT